MDSPPIIWEPAPPAPTPPPPPSMRPVKRKFTEVAVGKCHVQTANERFGPGARNAVSNRERSVHGIPTAAGDLVVDWPTQSPEADNELDNTIFKRIPSMQSHRNNLTALSQIHNLYLCAYQGRIFVYKPRGVSSHKLPPHIDLHIAPPPGKFSVMVGGYLDRRRPHTINHLVVGFYGEEEVVAACYDDGDIVAYYMKDVASLIETKIGPDGSDMVADLEPFLHDNVGSSAWGLAIHGKSRLIAVSSNRHEVTVFAPALRSSTVCTQELSCHPNCDVCEHPRVRRCKRSHRIVVVLGRQADNLPNICFLDDNRGFAEKVGGIDIQGALWLADIWRPRQKALRVPPLKCPHVKSEEFYPDMSRGWGIFAIPASSFMTVSNVEELLGLESLKDARVITPASQRCQPAVSIAKTIDHVPDNPCIAPHQITGTRARIQQDETALGLESQLAMSTWEAPLNESDQISMPVNIDMLDVSGSESGTDAVEEHPGGGGNFNNNGWASQFEEQDDDPSSSSLDSDDGAMIAGFLGDDYLGNGNLVAGGQWSNHMSLVNIYNDLDELDDEDDEGDDGDDDDESNEVLVNLFDDNKKSNMAGPFDNTARDTMQISGELATRRLSLVARSLIQAHQRMKNPESEEQHEKARAAAAALSHVEKMERIKPNLYFPHLDTFLPLTGPRRRDLKRFLRGLSSINLNENIDRTSLESLGKRYRLLRLYEKDIELRAPPMPESNHSRELAVLCPNVISMPEVSALHFHQHFRATGRLNMVSHVPELCLMVLGSPTGHVVLLTLTRLAQAQAQDQGTGEWLHGFRVEHVLPRSSDEQVFRKQIRPLYGMAVGPVPEEHVPSDCNGKAPTGRGRLMPRRYRLMLHYRNHDIVTYEITREEQTGRICIL